MKTERPDIYAQVTDSIIAAIENGAGPWQMPWTRQGDGLMCPVNIDTAKPYRGINIVNLWASACLHGFSTGVWGSYRQWQNKGFQVRKGEKASFVVFYKEFAVEEENEDTGEIEQGKRFMIRSSWVFNAGQVDGFVLPVQEEKDPALVLENVDSFVSETGAIVRHGGERAFWRPSADFIQMPERDQFIGSATSTATECYYSTLLHELVHWTAPEQRCNRVLGKSFGDKAYAMEELVAELGAAFLCAGLGITPEARVDHAAYIKVWLDVMKADKKAIFAAASAAAKATDYLVELQPKRLESAA